MRILHIEDNLAELNLVQEAFSETQLEVDLKSIRDGEEAIRYLFKENRSDGVPRPDIILLDLNVPRKNGFEVLAVIKTDPQLKNIPVLVFTGSESQDDIFKAYQLHANAYLRKPDDFSDYIAFLKRIVEFWGESVIFPESGSFPCKEETSR